MLIGPQLINWSIGPKKNKILKDKKVSVYIIGNYR